MYSIETADYGFRLTFGGFMKKPEMETWLAESQTKLKTAPRTFSVLIDMRTMKPIPPDAKEVMEKGQALYKNSGMQRSCVILLSATLTYQFKQIAKTSGIYAFERYIAADDTPDWEQKAIAWIKSGTDPDVHK
jgi:hypothetical protein